MFWYMEGLNLRPQGSIFSDVTKQTAYMLLPCKQPASTRVLCNWSEYLFLHAQMLSLASPYGNQPFPHRYIQQKMSNLPTPRPALRPIQITLRPNQTTLRPIQTTSSVIPV